MQARGIANFNIRIYIHVNKHTASTMSRSYLFTVVAFYAYQALEIGLLDMVEYLFVNSEVYEICNFPVVLGMKYSEPFRPQNSVYALTSGIVCSSWVLIPLAFLKAAILFAKTKE